MTFHQYYVWTRDYLKRKVFFAAWRAYLAERMRRFDTAKEYGRILKQNEEAKALAESQCTHRKGGYSRHFSMGGTDPQYAVIKHQFASGDAWIRCLRCSKQWKPGDEGYQEALLFPTKNCMSSGIQLMIRKSTPQGQLDVTKEMFRNATQNS